MEQAGAQAEDIAGIGITNQRATAVIWDKETGEPLCRAIVWQDMRTADRCAEINESEWGAKCKQATGWTVAPVYSSLMIEWLMKNNEEVNRKLWDGSAMFGTICYAVEGYAAVTGSAVQWFRDGMKMIK